MGRLEGKVAIITGGSQGMGASHAKLFLQEGAKVVITDINETEGQKFADGYGDNLLFIKHDVSNEEDWKKVVQFTLEHFNKIDVLVNNAGIQYSIPLIEMSAEQYLKVIMTNQFSVFLGMKYVAPHMIAQKSGSIINTSSMFGLVTSAGATGYTDSKFAIRGMTKTAAIEFAPHNVRVNSVHPGAIKTPMVMQLPELAAEVTKMIPMQRLAEPEEVSKLILFLASDDSSYSTGSEFIVDGGYVIQ
ncbi:SDR family NAD(P)-dependent oxidoreductase [Wohlfahrtiimonas larvae]|uniref:Glucose 1-dehydrogenase n=1 Tax=Wohlfahrtiimonas larvae TaxID=1157986 RepID=A0ABP9MGL0_9GAMM|nr:glucose 1-dehydrogenase [Wohlfahrtiimonas larvae]